MDVMELKCVKSNQITFYYNWSFFFHWIGRKWSIRIKWTGKRIKQIHSIWDCMFDYDCFSLVVLVNPVRNEWKSGHILFSVFSFLCRLTWTKRSKRYGENLFSMTYFLNYFYFIGEPAQALPGFKGEIVSFREIFGRQGNSYFFLFFREKWVHLVYLVLL